MTIAEVKNSLTGMIHGKTLTKVTNLNEVFQRAGATLLRKVDPPETIRIQQLASEIHDEVFDYALPTDLKGEEVIDLRPQVNRTSRDNPISRFPKPFDLRKVNNNYTIRYDDATKNLRFSKNVSPARKLIHNLNSITANGTWAVQGDAENLTVDTLNRVKGNASLNFDLDGTGTTGGLQITDMAQVDLSVQDEIGKVFVWVYLPVGGNVTSMELIWGNDLTAAFWTQTATSPIDVSAFKTGWNLVAFDWNGATETGTVDPETIDSFKITLTYDSTADTDFRIDEISVSNGQIFEIEYYSKHIFRTSSGTFQSTTSSGSDILNLDNDGSQIFILESLKAIAQQIQGKDSSFDMSYVQDELNGLEGGYKKFRFEHPSQTIKQKDFYSRPLIFSNTRASFLKR